MSTNTETSYMNVARSEARELFDIWMKNPELLNRNLDKARIVIDNYRKFEKQPGYEPELPSLLESFIFNEN
ncbi:MAG: hypothetical protein V1886_01895 [archaeon]